MHFNMKDWKWPSGRLKMAVHIAEDKEEFKVWVKKSLKKKRLVISSKCQQLLCPDDGFESNMENSYSLSSTKIRNFS
jgi:hypothetical protein